MSMKKNISFEEISAHDTPEESPGFLLWHVSTAWRGSIEQVLKSMGLTHPQFVILATLGWLTRNGNPVTQALVGKMARLDPNTVSQIIRGLEKKQLIAREKASDKRAKSPLLTEKGAAMLKKAMPLVEGKDAEFFQELGSAEKVRMLEIFRKLYRS